MLEQLYRLTPMEESFGINNVCLVDGQPRTLGLKELLQVFVDHRLDVVRRRSLFRRTKAADRLHLVEGLLVAILDIDEVIAVIRGSDDTAQARERLIAVFDLTQVQADYILEMPLRRLTKYSRLELDKEKAQLEETIAGLTALLENEGLLRAAVSDELADVAKAFGTPRRTVLLESAGTGAVTSKAAPLEVADDPCCVLLSSTGLLARTSAADPLPPPDPAHRAAHDVIIACVPTTARGEVAAVTSLGRMMRLPVLDMPALPPTSTAPSLSGGAPLAEFLALAKGEEVVALCSLARGLCRARAGDGAGRREARDAGLPAEQVRVGGHRAPGRRQRRGGRRASSRAVRSRLLDQRRPAAPVRGREGPPAGPDRRRNGGCDPGPGRPGRALRVRGPHPARRRVGQRGDHRRRLERRAARHAAGDGEGHPVRRVPGEGPGDRRRPVPPLPQGRGHPAARAGPARPRRIAAAANGVGVPLPEPDSRRDGSGVPLRAPVHAVGRTGASPA